MAVGERKYEIGPIERMQAHYLRLRFHRDLGAIAPFVQRLDDLGVLDVEFANPPQRIPRDRLLRAELCVVREVLQLAAPAVIVRIVRTRWLDSHGTRVEDLAGF